MQTKQVNVNADYTTYDSAHSDFSSLQDEIASLTHNAGEKVSDWWDDASSTMKAKIEDLKKDLDGYDNKPSTWDEMKAGVKEKMVDLRSAYDKAKIRMEKHLD